MSEPESAVSEAALRDGLHKANALLALLGEERENKKMEIERKRQKTNKAKNKRLKKKEDRKKSKIK